MSSSILENPLLDNNIEGGIGQAVNRIMVMTKDTSKVLNYLKSQNLENAYSLLGIENGVNDSLSFFEQKSYAVTMRVESEFLVNAVGPSNNIYKGLTLKDEYQPVSIVPIMADYNQHLTQFYSGKQLSEQECLENAAKAWDRPKFKHTFTLYDGKEAVSCLMLDHIHNNTAWIYCCGTLKKYQGKGHFRKLYNLAQNEFVNLGVKQVGLFCARHDYVSKIYKRLGFTEHSKFISARVELSQC